MIKIDIDTKKQIKLIEEKLNTLKNKVTIVLSKALNETAKQAKKDLHAEAKKIYAIKISGFNKATKINKATKQTLSAIIISKGKPISLKEFRVNPANIATGKNQPEIRRAKVIKKNKLKPLQVGNIKAFITKFKSGHIAIAQRKSQWRLPIKTLYSVSIPTMLGNEKRVYKIVEPKIKTNLQKNIEKQIKKLLEQKK